MQPSPSAPGGNQSWDGYDAASQLANHAQLAQNMDSADAQLVEVLQRDVQNPTPASNPPTNPPNQETSQNPPSVDQSVAASYPPAVTQSRPDDPTNVDLRKLPNYAQRQPAVQQIGPKRKRVFSNRTKTGCLTCRRRKKKCDEAHPSCKGSLIHSFIHSFIHSLSCSLLPSSHGLFLIFSSGNNCIRGGFRCEGYSSSRTWQKPSSAKQQQHPSIQSREGIYNDDPVAYPHELSPQQQDRPAPASPSQLLSGMCCPLSAFCSALPFLLSLTTLALRRPVKTARLPRCHARHPPSLNYTAWL